MSETHSPFLLGLDHAAGLAVHVEPVVGNALAAFERKLAQRHAARRVQVGRGHVLHGRAGGGKRAVDLLAGTLFGAHPGPLTNGWEHERAREARAMEAHERALLAAPGFTDPYRR